MRINQHLTPYNRTKANRTSIRYIVVHYVGATGGALANCKYYASKKVGSSAHYFVGHEGEIWQSVLDKDIAWHCGAKSYKHPEARNSNAIGIEMCCRKDPWRLEQATVDATVALVQYLMKKYNVPISRVIRHYDVTGKTCPAPYVNDSGAWNAFKARCAGGSVSPVEPPKPQTGGDPLVREYQQELNEQFGKGLDVDGIYGPKTEAAAVTIRKGAKGDLTRVLQKLLSSRTDYFGGAWDGIFGAVTENAVMKYQKQNGLTIDGIVGKATWRSLLTWGK